jgi:DNA repair protein RAD50
MNSTAGERLIELKREKDDSENQLQNLEKLRLVYDEYQKLIKDLVPAAEKTVEELTEEHERVTVPYDDVISPLPIFYSHL